MRRIRRLTGARGRRRTSARARSRPQPSRRGARGRATRAASRRSPAPARRRGTSRRCSPRSAAPATPWWPRAVVKQRAPAQTGPGQLNQRHHRGRRQEDRRDALRRPRSAARRCRSPTPSRRPRPRGSSRRSRRSTASRFDQQGRPGRQGPLRRGPRGGAQQGQGREVDVRGAAGARARSRTSRRSSAPSALLSDRAGKAQEVTSPRRSTSRSPPTRPRARSTTTRWASSSASRRTSRSSRPGETADMDSLATSASNWRRRPCTRSRTGL